jgi:hypothetical protein
VIDEIASKEKAMATKRKPAKKRPAKPISPPADEFDDDALYEEMMRLSREDEAAVVAGSERFLKQLGITGKPIGAKALREKLLKEGFDPESNEFSRGIIEMREE